MKIILKYNLSNKIINIEMETIQLKIHAATACHSPSCQSKSVQLSK